MTNEQKQLVLCYYDCLDPMGIDGAWNEEDVQATKKLQELFGLNPDGIWRSETEDAVKDRLCGI